MRQVILDIETIPVPFESLDEASQTYLMKFATTDEEQKKVTQQMALWAPTCQIVAIGVLDVGSKRGAVYYQDEGDETHETVEGGIRFSSGSERDILTRFWKVMRHVDQIITFNGRRFDCPVLMLRSGMCGVSPTKQLMSYRYATDTHIDLLDQLTYYGAVRKFNLDMMCKAFGIDSPKSHGITGHDVAPLYHDGKFSTIAQYCAGDLWATRELYIKWRDYLQP